MYTESRHVDCATARRASCAEQSVEQASSEMGKAKHGGAGKKSVKSPERVRNEAARMRGYGVTMVCTCAVLSGLEKRNRELCPKALSGSLS